MTESMCDFVPVSLPAPRPARANHVHLPPIGIPGPITDVGERGFTESPLKMVPRRRRLSRDVASSVPSASTAEACNGGGPADGPASDLSPLSFSRRSDDSDTPYTSIGPILPQILDPDPNRPQYTVPRMGNDIYRVRACQRDFPTGEKPPQGWEQFTHPDGRPFFWHQERRALTMDWMPDGAVSECVHAAMDHVQDKLDRRTGQRILEGCQIVISLTSLTTEGPCNYAATYYLVDTEKECVFWVEDFVLPRELFKELNASIGISSLGLYLRYQFYKHWDNFPNVQKVTASRVREWRKILCDARSDVMFSNTSTAIYDESQFAHMLEMLDHTSARLETAQTPGIPLEGDWLPGRMMKNIYYNQFMNLHGQRGARCHAHQSVFHPQGSAGITRSWFITVCGYLLFQAPQRHLASLLFIFVDGSIPAQGSWKKFVSALMREWKGHRVAAALLLAADVSLFGINDFPEGIPQIACFFSAISSCAVFVLITVLEGHLQEVNQWGSDKAEIWLHCMHSKSDGLAILAILFGLSHGLTLWSMIFFAVSLMSFCMNYAKLSTATSVGVYFLCHIVVLCWASWVTQENHEAVRNYKKLPEVVFEQVVERARSAGKMVSQPIRQITRSLHSQPAKIPRHAANLDHPPRRRRVDDSIV